MTIRDRNFPLILCDSIRHIQTGYDARQNWVILTSLVYISRGLGLYPTCTIVFKVMGNLAEADVDL